MAKSVCEHGFLDTGLVPFGSTVNFQEWMKMKEEIEEQSGAYRECYIHTHPNGTAEARWGDRVEIQSCRRTVKLSF